MLVLWCAGEEYTASGRPKRKRKNRTRKDKDYVFEGDDEFVDGDGEACFLVSSLFAPHAGPVLTATVPPCQ
jgi:hypothetical protein